MVLPNAMRKAILQDGPMVRTGTSKGGFRGRLREVSVEDHDLLEGTMAVREVVEGEYERVG